MLSQQQKEMFAKLNMPYEAVAVKFLRNRPAGYEPAEGKGMFCAFLKRAQEEHRAFYITVDNEDCMGKVVMGMKELETNHGSGQVGCEMGMFRTPAANARLYYEAPTMKRGTVNSVPSPCVSSPPTWWSAWPTPRAPTSSSGPAAMSRATCGSPGAPLS